MEELCPVNYVGGSRVPSESYIIVKGQWFSATQGVQQRCCPANTQLMALCKARARMTIDAKQYYLAPTMAILTSKIVIASLYYSVKID